MFRYILLSVCTTFSLLFMMGGAQQAGALNSTDFRMRILPQNCVFDVINAGTQELIYYTPEACGIPTDTPPEPTPTAPSLTPAEAQQPRPLIRPDIIEPPQINPESGGVTVNGSEIILSGSSRPNSQVNVYIAGTLAGSVLADSEGRWEFRYRALYSPVIFQFEACLEGVCSVLSQSISVNAELVAGFCVVDFQLSQYRFWDISTGEEITVESRANFNFDATVEIDWGNGDTELISYAAGSNFNYSKKYDDPGLYNGRIRLIVDEECYSDKYFSVQVAESSRFSLNLFSIKGLIFISLVLAAAYTTFAYYPKIRRKIIG